MTLTRKKVVVGGVLLLAAAAVAMAVSALLVQRSSAPALSETVPQEMKKTNEAANKQEPKAVRPMLNLPGATPIVALDEDYRDNASLWRVVSKDYPLENAADFTPKLAAATLPSVHGDQLRPEATDAAKKMFAAAKTAGYSLIVGSGYRSYATQQQLFASYSATYGEAHANTFSARAGQSEHQTGLAFDVGRADQKCLIDNCFGDLPEAEWVASHCFLYGFIVRYPADKTAVTKYQYEPWHLRYVGIDLATALHESGLTLDEARPYLERVRDQLNR